MLEFLLLLFPTALCIHHHYKKRKPDYLIMNKSDDSDSTKSTISNPSISTIDKPPWKDLPIPTITIHKPADPPSINSNRQRIVAETEQEEYIEKESIGDSLKSTFVVYLGKFRSVREKIVSKTKKRWTLPRMRRKGSDGGYEDISNSL
jgi:hypothetical protein